MARGAVAALAGILCMASPAPAGAGDPFPGVAESWLVLVNDQPVWAHEPLRRLPPASLTKIMLALLVLESGRLDERVRVGKDAAGEDGSRMGLREGDLLAVRDLLAGTLITSGNDACRALAEHFGPGVEAFVAAMNRRAEELGMRDTRFDNPCGFDGEAHRSTVRDLALLARAAMADPRFSEIVARETMTVRTMDGRRTFRLKNSNALVGTYRWANGVKSGYTRRAGRCLIASAERDGDRVLVIMLGATERWWNTIDMIEAGFRVARRLDP